GRRCIWGCSWCSFGSRRWRWDGCCTSSLTCRRCRRMRWRWGRSSPRWRRRRSRWSRCRRRSRCWRITCLGVDPRIITVCPAMILTLGTTPALQRTMTFSRLTIDAVNRATSIREYASGKGINVARVVHRLRKPCVATGFLGGDSGSFCRHDMDAAGIGHDFVTVASRTRMCVTLVDQASRTATELIEEAGPVTASDTAKLLVKLELLLQHARVLVLSCTVAPGFGDDFYARCLRLAATTNVPAILDAKGAPLQLALAERPFVVKPNRVELSATVNHAIESDGQLRDAMRQIISRGANWVVVTNGP